METTLLAVMRKQSTATLKNKLNKGLYTDEKKEAAISVLKQRGIDVSGYEIVKEVEVEDPIVEQIAEKGLQERASQIITKIVELEDTSLNLKAGEIIGDTDEGELTVNQVNQLIELEASLITKKREDKPKKTVSKKVESPKSIKPRKTQKVAEIPEDLKSKVAEILSLSVQKKEKIIKLSEAGLSRSQILSLHFVDPTYIYDLYRELKL